MSRQFGRGVTRFVTNCDKEGKGESLVPQNCITSFYFMDEPLYPLGTPLLP